MKQIGIAITDPSDWTAQALYSAVNKAGHRPLKFRLHDVTSRLLKDNSLNAGGIEPDTLDALIVRDVGGGGSGSGTEDMSYRFDVLCNLEASGVLIVNTPESIRTAANKYMTSYLFKKNGLPTPGTVLTTDPNKALNAIKQWGRAVIKPIFGYKGMDIHCLTDDAHSIEIMEKAIAKRGVLYLQQFIPNPGRDIRVFIVNKRAVGAIYRTAPPGSWINNLSKGGSPGVCPMSPEIKDLACQATEAVGTVYAGVDLIEAKEGLSILEVNGTPSGKGIYDACGVDVAHDIVRYVVESLIK